MSSVLAQDQKWSVSEHVKPVILGPFASLRDGVTGYDLTNPNPPRSPKADFFMWEHFTTKPYFDIETAVPYPSLKKVGELYTPWPSWHIAASTAKFPSPESDWRISQLCEALDKGIAALEADRPRVVHLLGTGDLGCFYSEADATEWVKDVRFAKTTRGVDKDIITGVVDVLKTAGVVPQDISNDEAVQRVIGIPK